VARQADALRRRQNEHARLSAAGRLADSASGSDLPLQPSITGVELPADNVAAAAGERQAQFGDLRDGAHGASGHEIPARALVRLLTQVLGTLGERRDVRGLERVNGERLDDLRGGHSQEPSLLADGVNQRRTSCRQRDDERKAGETCATADVEQARSTPQIAKSVHADEAVQHVVARYLFGRSQSGQIDDRIPGEQQSDVTVDRDTDLRSKGHIRFVEAGVDGLPEDRRQRRELGRRLRQWRTIRWVWQRRTPRKWGPIRVSSMPERP